MKKRIAIVGAGSRGVHCFGELIRQDPRAELVALCEPNHHRRAAAARILGLDQVAFFDSLEALLAEDRPDAVVITTPDWLHADGAEMALRAGVNVLIDKPLATTVADCRRIIAAAEESGKLAMIGFNLRHHPVIRKIKEVIDSGVLGRIFLMENREFYDGGRTYMARWNRSYRQCGGLWIHKGSHDFDLFNYFLGFPVPVKVSAFAAVNVLNPTGLPFTPDPGLPPGPDCSHCPYADGTCPDVRKENSAMWDEAAESEDRYRKDRCIYLSDKDVHDNGIAMVEYADGARASHLECFVTDLTDRMYTIVGDRGQLEASLDRRCVTVRPRWGKGQGTFYQIPESDGSHGGADPGLVDSFIRAISGEEQPRATAREALLATAIGEAAELSRREERTVFLRELGV